MNPKFRPSPESFAEEKTSSYYKVKLLKRGDMYLEKSSSDERARLLSEAKKNEEACASSKILAGDFGRFRKVIYLRAIVIIILLIIDQIA